jgi:hypothetical protein
MFALTRSCLRLAPSFDIVSNAPAPLKGSLPTGQNRRFSGSPIADDTEQQTMLQCVDWRQRCLEQRRCRCSSSSPRCVAGRNDTLFATYFRASPGSSYALLYEYTLSYEYIDTMQPAPPGTVRRTVQAHGSAGYSALKYLGYLVRPYQP